LSKLPIDLLSLTAHKFHGPQGIGALYIADRPGCQLSPVIFGGSQERRIRPGTHAIHQILGFGLAAELAGKRLDDGLRKLRALRERLWRGIADVPDLRRNGSAGETFAGILNVSAAGVDGESLLLALDPLCVATGAACNSQTGESSYVLRAMGLGDRLAQGAIRFSFGAETSEADIDVAIERYRFAVAHLRLLAPMALSGAPA
jgi:cysteine desulfurase